MSKLRRILFLTFVLASLSLHAADGHWQGVIRAEAMQVDIEVDLSKKPNGELAGTFTNAVKNVHGFPLSNVAADGKNVTFAINAQGGGVFRATLAADGRSMSGTFATRGPDGKELELPFELTRTGDAKIEGPPKHAAVGKELEGRWSGSMDVEGSVRELGLHFINHPDGTATAVLTAGEAQVPITRVEQKQSQVSLDVKTIGGSYAGTLNAEGTELTGTWTQGPFEAPLTFRRAVAESGAAEELAGRWAKAVGGREKVAAIRSTYREATIRVAGMDGTIKVWRTPDGKYRKEEQIGAMSIIETFDGTNATLQQGDTAPRAMAGPELARARSLAFANSGAMFFAFFPERRSGVLALDGNDTLVLKPEGGIDWRVTLDPRTSLPKTMMHQQNGRMVTVTFVAYETVDGMQFEKEIHRTMGDPRFDSVIQFTKTVINPAVDATMFAASAP